MGVHCRMKGMTNRLNEAVTDELTDELTAETLGRIAGHVRGILTELGLDLTDANLRDTDKRVARMYAEIFAGLRSGSQPQVTCFPNDEGYRAMVIEKEIPFYSVCAH